MAIVRSPARPIEGTVPRSASVRGSRRPRRISNHRRGVIEACRSSWGRRLAGRARNSPIAATLSAGFGAAPDPAYYLSRLAVAREAAGAGLGYRIIDWVGEKAAAHRKAFVRVATTRDNPALREYYERAGFEHVTDPPGAKWPTSLYEKRAAESPQAEDLRP
ncbi:GNAT family N-acetyltransferase [Amycolatopsis sp. NPDC049868]|uniref:GNAT family N-acetyltransferase n=1 Tax=Amycolatopsis sp. NPDC049868 TaxID=3363934 RepID=UPI003797FDA5